ncbi:MAG: hypothetical protein J6Q64_03805 [Clostridia bacterium]|nr:hypothetical protein [Clostridia bacterium]
MAESFGEAFSKASREPPAKRRSLSAESEISYQPFFLPSFFFGLISAKEKADYRPVKL